MANNKAIGARIREARIKANLDQGTLGAMIGIGKSSISEWERGKRSPDIDKIDDIANALHVSAAYILGWEDNDEESSNILYISRPTGNPSTDELRKHLHDIIDQMDEEDLKLFSDLTIRMRRE